MHLLVSIGRTAARSACLLAVIVLIAAAATQSQATSIGLGMAEDFAVLALNGSYVYMGSDATIINGDFGIGPNSFGDLEKGTINGSLYLDTTSAANIAVDAQVTITGFTPTVDLSPVNSDAVMASASFAALPTNRPDVTAITNDLTINGNGGDNVFSLTSVSLTAKTLTLSGNANDYFIFNVTGDLHFQASNIVLTGGVTANHVIFNVIGSLSGNAVDLSANGTFRGTILAPDRAIQAETLLVIGALIGGRDSSFDELDKDGAGMSVHASATINHEPFQETSSAGCISITKSVSPTDGPVGTPLTYTFVIANCGTVSLTVSIMDTVLGDLTGAFVADHGSNVLTAGTSETFTVPSAIPNNNVNPIRNVVTVTGQAGGMLYVDSDAATVTIPVTISGGAYNDVACDGDLDTVDTPLAGATFVLSDVGGNPVTDLDGDAVTSQTGSTFSFTNLAPGIYMVTEINPLGYSSTNAIPGTGGTKLTNDMIQVDAVNGFSFPNHIFLDGQCELLVYQAYPGNSNNTNRSFAGNLGFVEDNTTSVPGILQIIPQDSGESAWANYVPPGAMVLSVTLVKEAPLFSLCPAAFPGTTVMQQGAPNIRLWWPLMYELPGTRWTVTIATNTGPVVWKWRVDATIDSLKDTLQLFHELPFGRCQVPLVSDEELYPVLQAKLDAVSDAIDDGDMVLAGLTLDDFEAEVMSAYLATCPAYPWPAGPGTGIVQTVENPAACKLLADAEYISDKYGL